MRTKIICTIGPKTESEQMIKQLIENGMDIARLNFSHDTYLTHKKKIDRIRKWSKKLKKDVKILCDLQGPKIRIADFPNPPKKLTEGKKYIFTTISSPDINKNDIVIDDHYLHNDLLKNDVILIDDGQIELVVTNIKNHKIEAKVINGGLLFPRKGVNVPLTKTTTASLTEKDIKDLDFILKQKPDWIALSFVQDDNDVIKLRNLINNKNIKIMCKIERAAAIENLNKIIAVADGIMVARGDLGAELPIEQLPLIQKRIIKNCNFADKPVATATHMLASMVSSPIPTRAEVTDISNAIFDGTNAVMLSNETAIGAYHLNALKIMKKIVTETEKYLFDKCASI